MNDEYNFEQLFETGLELDEEEAKQRSRDEAGSGRMDIIDDQEIRLLLRQNRLALLKGSGRLLPPSAASQPGFAYYDLPLMCVAHAHPKCRFDWVRLIIDLSVTGGAVIRDMAPREVEGKPVELETTVGGGLKFDVVGTNVEASLEHTTRRTVYYPHIVSSGIDLQQGWWDFRALADSDLHVDRELRLLVAALTGEPVKARFNLQAEVRMNGILGKIPLLARWREIDATYSLC